jgi:hypothetical protein
VHEERFDIFIPPDAKNIEQLKTALHDVIDDPDIEQITAHDLLGEYPAIQYVPPDGSFHIDIVTRIGEAFAFADLEVERIPFEQITVPVVTARTLYRMKKDTVRGVRAGSRQGSTKGGCSRRMRDRRQLKDARHER